MIEFINDKKQKLLKAILLHYSTISPAILRGILAKKEIKVNDIRTKENIEINENDKITIYIEDKYLAPKLDIIYTDDNIIIVDKPSKLEVTSPDKNKITLEKILNDVEPAIPVHRLDTNTRGLVIFAKNERVKDEFILAFENGCIDKFYYALAFGQNLKSGTFIDYMEKESGGIVKVHKNKLPHSLTAKLGYEVLENVGDYYLLKILLHTGRTHQIRAQLAYHNIYILGDGKYGDKSVNRKVKFKSQALMACSLKFHFPKNSKLSYLNDLHFELPCKYDIKSVNK